MKADIYIVYDAITLKVIKTFTWFGEAEDFAKENNLKWVNRTHPKAKDLIKFLIW